MYWDKTLSCKECGNDFIFTASEQEFYAEKGFTNEPGRCPACRAARKAESRGNRSGYERTERQMFPAVCSACGKDTTVPFQPKRERPIYCRDCYSSQPHRN